MKPDGRVVQEFGDFVREQREINRDQKGINRRLEKFVRGTTAELQELKAINRG